MFSFSSPRASLSSSSYAASVFCSTRPSARPFRSTALAVHSDAHPPSGIPAIAEDVPASTFIASSTVLNVAVCAAEPHTASHRCVICEAEERRGGSGSGLTITSLTFLIGDGSNIFEGALVSREPRGASD